MQGLAGVAPAEFRAAGQEPLLKLEIFLHGDEIDWVIRSSAADNNWNGITYGIGLFVTVAASGVGNRVMTSPDGIDWTIRSSAADNNWHGITYANGLFVTVAASGTGNRVMTSPDGINWTIRSSAADNNWNGITYGNGLFVAVASSGTGNRVMTSPNGIDWTIRSSAADNFWNGIIYANGLFVTIADSGVGNRVMTSPNGIDWTIRSSAADNDWRSITYGNGLFVVVADSGVGNRVMTSPNGIDWTIRSSAADNDWRSITYANGLFVAVADTGVGNRVMTSPNGIDWTIRSSAADNNWNAITCGNGLFVVVAESGTGDRVMTSANGVDLSSYVQDISISLGGASMTPQPVEGTWSATIFNKDGVFHPDHPGSYKDYLKTGRRIRISVGAVYGGVPVYWPRITGYMDMPKFSAPDMTVAISGGDYMKRLRETELRRPTNYWGSDAPYNSIASDGIVGAEIYAEGDAMEIGGGEANNVDNWGAEGCDFDWFADEGGGSDFVGRMTGQTVSPVRLINANVGAAVAGARYQVRFKHRIVGGDGTIRLHTRILQASGVCTAMNLYPTDDWKEEVFEFLALDTGPIEWRFRIPDVICDLRLDQFSISTFIPYWDRYYELNGGFGVPATGPYYVTLDGVPCWQGEGDDEWKYVADAEAGPDPPAHPAKIVYFNINKVMANGVNNLIIYYFTATALEDVVARLLYQAGVCDPTTDAPYADEAAAKTRMEAQDEYAATGVNVDMVWFEPGSNCLSAITKICERCDYRFYFKYDGSPIFREKPTAGGAVFTFTDPKHIATISTYQDQNEIKNRIVIKGLKQSETVSKEETMPSYLTDERADDAGGGSIELYGERTKTITNHLFQTLGDITAMCIDLLAEYKDPKWYSDLEIPFNPVPLELGDNIEWEEMLSPTRDITQEGIIRDIKIDGFSVTYKCVLK